MAAPAPVVRADTITRLAAGDAAAVVISGSHGGVYAGYCAARAGVRAVIFNDAGIGRDRAGIGSLDYLQALGMPAATVDHRTGCIANAADMAAHGRISFVNPAAAALGCAVGQNASECADRMALGPMWSADPPAYAEARFEILPANAGPAVVGCDSASLLRPDDSGRIVVTASHGGLLGGRPDGAIGPAPLAISFSDAGVGKHEAGIARLADLDVRGIAAATVAADTARIGDARSCYADGRISHLNDSAAALGAEAGLMLAAWIGRLQKAQGRERRT